MIRFVLWRVFGMLAVACAAVVGLAVLAWLSRGGLGSALRRSSRARAGAGGSPGLLSALVAHVRAIVDPLPPPGHALVIGTLVVALGIGGAIACSRTISRRRRRYVRLRVVPYRGDRASVEALVGMYDSVQFLDSPGDSREGGGDVDGELVGTGADAGDLAF